MDLIQDSIRCSINPRTTHSTAGPATTASQATLNHLKIKLSVH
jgi:hypothetical protein